MNAAERIKDGANTSTAGTVEVMQMDVETMNSCIRFAQIHTPRRAFGFLDVGRHVALNIKDYA
ncbi:hypothetical protein KGM_205280 [Danaus plexippus plexippus]|uniref:Uncharacterized protein n=1 Tax=Danaus plexippus plexippus TaxID=278856 RepID=A0A212EJL9_DANPL|nr:hypothetical protein KGM_205280 [Danaus plexippus plexippus]